MKEREKSSSRLTPTQFNAGFFPVNIPWRRVGLSSCKNTKLLVENGNKIDKTGGFWSNCAILSSNHCDFFPEACPAIDKVLAACPTPFGTFKTVDSLLEFSAS